VSLYSQKSKLFPPVQGLLSCDETFFFWRETPRFETFLRASARENNRPNKGNKDGKTHITFHEKRKQVQKISPTTTVVTFYSSDLLCKQ
jgi:hypothetical protein